MTNDELQAHIRAINDACARGEIEQYSGNHETPWKPFRQAFNTAPGYYRIKPKPREVWIAIDRMRRLESERICESAITLNGPPIHAEGCWVRFREVIE